VKLLVDGVESEVSAAPHHTLVDALRDELGLRSVREACGVGMCGACTVLLDGEPVSGCLVLAGAAEGREIRTRSSARVRDAFVEHTAFQCSFCTPGFLLTADRLLEEKPAATDEEIAEYLAGNLCRCGSYVKILDAVRSLTAR
jgi:carbon-monoxide dehydrogenase small subunit